MNKIISKLLSKIIIITLLTGLTTFSGCRAYISKDTTNILTKEVLGRTVLLGTPDFYEVVTNRMEIYNSTIDSWIKIIEGDFTHDLVSPEGDERIRKAMEMYFGDRPLPKGIYTKLRTRMHVTFKIKGSISYGDRIYYTTPFTQPFLVNKRAIALSTTGPAKTGTFTCPASLRIEEEGFRRWPDPGSKLYYLSEYILSPPLKITKKITAKELCFKTDPTNTLLFDIKNKMCWPHRPNISVTVLPGKE